MRKRKTVYLETLRKELPELVNIAAGKEPCPPELDAFAAAVRVAGEKQEQAADEATAAFAKTILE
jgi:hypothetical protein